MDEKECYESEAVYRGAGKPDDRPRDFLANTAVGLNTVTERKTVPGSLLDEAKDIVTGARARDYGPPDENYAATAAMWTAYLHRRFDSQDDPDFGVLDARDICWLNILQKASRDAYARRRDNLVDAAGFAENADRCPD